MSNHGLTHEQARQIGAKTLWIGDIEPWMDEAYIQSLFAQVSKESPHNAQLKRNALILTFVNHFVFACLSPSTPSSKMSN